MDTIETPIAPLLTDLRAAVDALIAADPESFANGASVTALTAELARLNAVACRQAHAFVTVGEWDDTGAKTPTAWVTTTCRIPKRVAQQRQRLGRFCARYDLVAHAFSTGAISIDHLDVLHAACHRNRFCRRAFNEHEATLVGWARTMHYADFRQAVDLWVYAADETSAEHGAEHQHEQRRLHLSQTLDNLWFCDAVLDPVSGQIINDTITAVERELFDTDWAEVKAALGHQPTADQVAEHTRTPAQRRVDALVEIMIRARTTPAGGRRPQPLITVIVDHQAFMKACHLAWNTVTTPGTVARLLDNALIERIVFDGPDRVLSVGYQRAFSTAVQRAITTRDRTCRHPYCDEPAEHCQIDHIHPYALGGPSTLTNGRLLCRYHNNARNTALEQRLRDRLTTAGLAQTRPPPDTPDP